MSIHSLKGFSLLLQSSRKLLTSLLFFQCFYCYVWWREKCLNEWFSFHWIYLQFSLQLYRMFASGINVIYLCFCQASSHYYFFSISDHSQLCYWLFCHMPLEIFFISFKKVIGRYKVKIAIHSLIKYLTLNGFYFFFSMPIKWLNDFSQCSRGATKRKCNGIYGVSF